jgi:hypothetical protein
VSRHKPGRMHRRPGERMAARSAGLGTARAIPMTDPPAKEDGRHRWIAIASYTMTPNQAAAADAGSTVTLDPSMLMAFAVGCLDCEGEYHEVRLDLCPAGDQWPAR